ncbi:hypothetical protein Godav_006650 [Gossypium davidsonii]|uniref:Uncharacterized protein n=1 Tax=Gossypium davidsonii TaxID=34287 RepID=A0A7J8S5B2_GOSDV|nr:hypothetical protein [Gossypium davidsonii]
MQLKVQVISEEIVKPSSPTADRLRRYQLSFLDQLNASFYNALVYFYPKICDTEANKITVSNRLKHSISNALTYFYPLAGRITDDQLFVDCNDEGIPFLEVGVECQLSDVLNNPIPKELNKLLPFEFHGSKKVPLGIQFNVFDCGGIAVGVCISHKIGDALSFFSFVNMWAAIARGETNLIAPEFKSASLFPPRDLWGYTPGASLIKKGQTITKRFVFCATKVEEIRRKYAENTNQTRPTRVEALSAFIWERFLTAFGARSRPDTLCAIVHLVNLRARIEPPMPGSLFGNLSGLAMTIPSMDSNIVTQIRDSIKTVNKEYVMKLKNGYTHQEYLRDMATSYGKGEMVSLTFTSLCRFPMYEADFGWGKPIWAGSADRQIKNVTTFTDAINGDGIEAWVTLNEEEMAKFDCDEELLAYVNNPKSL